MDTDRWRRIKEVTADAMEADAGRRDELLDRACGTDLELRAEVDRLLREHDRPTALPELLDPAHTPMAFWAPRADPTLTKTALGKWSPSESSGLASDVLEQSGRRLGLLALAYAVLYFLINLVNEVVVHYSGEFPYRQSDHWISQFVMTTLILLSLAVWALVRSGRVRGTAVITAGLWFEILGTLGMALGMYAGGIPDEKRIAGVVWMCVWIVAFPFVVPSPPRRALAAAFASAAMGPLAIAIMVGTGAYPWPPIRQLLAMFTPLFICATLASAGGRIIYRLGADLRKAQQLGSYRLESLIGRGGMGEVWVARHHTLARPAALKLIRPEMMWEGGPSGSATELFEREAQNTAALTSPHTVKLYDYGLTADGVFYYAMELLDGLDLDSLVRRYGPLPPARAVHFLEQICQSLGEAHERGLVHRDIKPANLFVCRQGLVFDFVKVLDFGLVQHHQEVAPDPDARPAEIAGTPGFMAPESLADGEASPLSDLYAVGCVGYWLLTGRPVFDGTEQQGAGTTPPSVGAPHTVPAELDRLILSCLARRPADRPASVDALRSELLELAPRLPWTQDQARSWWRAVHEASTEITTAPA